MELSDGMIRNNRGDLMRPIESWARFVILSTLRDNPGADLRKISDLTDLSDDDIFVVMRCLVREGVVRVDDARRFWLN